MDEPEPQVVTVFRSRLRDGVQGEYGPLAEEMLTLARAMPGFVDFKTFSAPDGERVSIITFESPSAHTAWREHPAHRAAQQRGREALYAAYTIQVCQLLHTRRFEGAST